MVTKELIDFIQKSRLFGRTDEQIKSMLSEKGWKAEDIVAGFASSEFNPPPPEEPSKPVKKSHSKAWIFAIITLVLIIGFGVGCFFAYQRFLKPEAPQTEEKATNLENALNEEQKKDLVFAESLRTCAKYKDTFLHPFTGGEMSREILGIVDGKCRYVEEMPNNGKMTCNYSESDMVAAADAYKEFVESGSAKVEVGGNTATGESQVESTVGNEGRENPLQTFLENGVCEISGY